MCNHLLIRVLGFMCLSCSSVVQGQDTLAMFNLDEVVISAKLEKMFSSINSQKIDSTILQFHSSQNIASLLAQQSHVKVVSYGASGLSSVRLRGGQSNHTAVVWNGFNIQDPLNGGFNFSSVGCDLTDEVIVQRGGGSAVYGSGAVGGSIHLNNAPNFNSGLQSNVSYHLGSFGKQYLLLGTEKGSKNFFTSFKVFSNRLKNDFDFVNVAKYGSPVDTFKDAALQQYAFLQENYLNLNGHHLSSQFWYQENERGVPSNMTGSDRGAFIKNKWVRLGLNWNKRSGFFYYEGRSGFFYNGLNFVKPSIDLNALHTSYSNTSEALVSYRGGKNQELTLGFNNNYTFALSDNFSDSPFMNKFALYASDKIRLFKRVELNLSVRREYSEATWRPITYLINSKIKLNKSIYFTGSYAKSHRTPTFNDLFWAGNSAVGNVNLEDESGISQDLGLLFQQKRKRFEYKGDVAFYQNEFSNMIQWAPQGTIWLPLNQKLVKSRGIETNWSFNQTIKKVYKLNLNLAYTFTSSIIKEKAENESSAIIGKQLIYTPKHQGNIGIGASNKKIQTNLNIQYNGKVYTQSDNKVFLYPSILTNASISYQLKRKDFQCTISGKVNNVFDQNYMVMIWYPMPGRNYELGLKFLIN